MKNLMIVLAVGLMAAPAFAAIESVSIKTQDHDKIVVLNGGVGGAAQELFQIFDKAGLQKTQNIEGTELHGKNLYAYVAFLSGARYGVTLTANEASSNATITRKPNQAEVIVTGEVAQELYDTMKAAGLPVKHMIDAASVTGKTVSCTVLYVGHAHYSCALEIETR